MVKVWISCYTYLTTIFKKCNPSPDNKDLDSAWLLGLSPSLPHLTNHPASPWSNQTCLFFEQHWHGSLAYLVTYFLLTFPLKWPRITLFLPLLDIIAGLLLEDSKCHLMKPIKKCLCPSFTTQFLLSHNVISHKITRLFSHNAFLTRSALTYMVSLPYHWFAALYQRSANILVKAQVVNILGL